MSEGNLVTGKVNRSQAITDRTVRLTYEGLERF